VLRESIGFVTANDVFVRLNGADPRASIATVYRQLGALRDEGLLHAINTEEGQVFRWCGEREHHHHLVCVRCGNAVELHPPDEAWLAPVLEEYGFELDCHVFEAFGRCASCRAAASGD